MEPFHLDFHCLQMYVRIYLVSEFTRLYPYSFDVWICHILKVQIIFAHNEVHCAHKKIHYAHNEM